MASGEGEGMAPVDDASWEFSTYGELTPELVEALAVEARRGYDCDLSLQFVGRPAYEAEGEPLPPRIVFRVPPETLAAAQRRADDGGIALSELAGRALREYLDRPGPGAVTKTSRGS